MNIDKILTDYFASQVPACSSSSFPNEPVVDKPRSKFRIGQIVEAIAELMCNPPTGETAVITGRIKNIAQFSSTYWYLIWDKNGDVWSAAEDQMRRPREVPNGWEPKESK